MSELSVREQVTAAICRAMVHTHPGIDPSHPGIPAERCNGGLLADAALGVFAAELERLATVCDAYAKESTWPGFIAASKQIAYMIRHHASEVSR